MENVFVKVQFKILFELKYKDIFNQDLLEMSRAGNHLLYSVFMCQYFDKYFLMHTKCIENCMLKLPKPSLNYNLKHPILESNVS